MDTDHTALARRIALEVMRWSIKEGGLPPHYTYGDGNIVRWCDSWQPHESGDDMLRLLNRLAKCGVMPDLEYCGNEWMASLRLAVNRWVIDMQESAPLAVCLAVGKLLDAGWTAQRDTPAPDPQNGGE